MNAATFINQDSGVTAYFTPSHIVEAARLVMGGIDLDPASCAKANETIKAKAYYDRAGLALPWAGRVWINHPFSRLHNADWIKRIVQAYQTSEIEQACCITFASTSEKWFAPLQDYPQCYLSPRTNYLLPNGSVASGVPKGSVVTYLGHNIDTFIETFHGKLGRVMLPPAYYQRGHFGLYRTVQE